MSSSSRRTSKIRIDIDLTIDSDQQLNSNSHAVPPQPFSFTANSNASAPESKPESGTASKRPYSLTKKCCPPRKRVKLNADGLLDRMSTSTKFTNMPTEPTEGFCIDGLLDEARTGICNEADLKEAKLEIAKLRGEKAKLLLRNFELQQSNDTYTEIVNTLQVDKHADEERIYDLLRDNRMQKRNAEHANSMLQKAQDELEAKNAIPDLTVNPRLEAPATVLRKMMAAGRYITNATPFIAQTTELAKTMAGEVHDAAQEIEEKDTLIEELQSKISRCASCREAPADMVYSGCGHLAACSACSRLRAFRQLWAMKCMVCRKESALIKAFFVKL